MFFEFSIICFQFPTIGLYKMPVHIKTHKNETIFDMKLGNLKGYAQMLQKPQRE